MTVGERIKARRKYLGLSAEQVAWDLGISPSTVYRYENGAIEKMGIDKLSPIAEALHTTPAYLIGWTDDWYNYDKDEDNRFCEIPVAQFEALKEKNRDDLAAVWHDWLIMQEDTFLEAQRGYDHKEKAPTPKGERPKSKLRSIARLEDSKITPEQDEQIADYIDFLLSKKKEL